MRTNSVLQRNLLGGASAVSARLFIENMQTRDAGAKAPWLVADIGGTNARFGWVANPSEAPSRVESVQTLPVKDFATVTDAANAYLETLAGHLGRAQARPGAASFAVATPVSGDWIQFTNSPWCFSRVGVRDSLQLSDLMLCNDFEALARSLPTLGADQLRSAPGWPGLIRPAQQAMAVVGPGTGLGVAGLVPFGHEWVPVPGEGGHVTLTAKTDLEWAFLGWLRQHGRCPNDHISAERVLCGEGLSRLHRAVSAVHGSTAELLPAAAVADAAERGDAVAEQALEMFCAWLGSVCGNAALTYGARGGLYVGGGMVPRLGARFFSTAFRERFEGKGRFQAYLSSIPSPVIADTLASLTGAASLLKA